MATAMTAPASAPAQPAFDFFGSEADIAAARAGRAQDPAGSSTALAWYWRQRDTRAALRHADEAEAALTTHPRSRSHPHSAALAARIALVRAEAAWLFQDLAAAHRLWAEADAGFAAIGDAVGRGDAALLQAAMRDQAGGDRSGAVLAAQAHYAAAGAADRMRLAATWRACVEATGDLAQAEAEWQAVLDEAAARQQPGLLTYVEGARAMLKWRHGDAAGGITAYQRGFDAALASGQLQAATTLAQNIGIAYSLLNDHEGAMQWAERARQIVQPTGWPYATAWCLMQTGAILVGLGRAAEARTLLLAELPLFDRAQGTRNHVLACQVLSEACLALQDDAAALHWCETALAGAQAAPYDDLVSGLLRHHALALSRAGRVADALASAQQALALAQADGDGTRQAGTRYVLAQIAAAHGLPPPPGSDAASGPIHHLAQALADGERIAGFQPPPEWLEAMSAAQQQVGDLDRALHFERAASRARQAQQTQRSEALATALMVRHQTAQALAEAARLRAQAEASELRAELLAAQGALEKERLQTMLVHAGKLAAVGRLAAGVVHEMSHPVGSVTLLAQALSDAPAFGDAPAATREALQALLGEARRLQQFVARLRHFARAEPLHCTAQPLQAVLADARQLVAPRLGVAGVQLSVMVPEATVVVDAQRVALALANLIFNAADALSGRPQARVSLSGEAQGREFLLHVDDNGPGLPEAVLAHLFEPFYTTRPEGLGLGLTLAFESLTAMNGRLTAANRAEGGARFTMTLPLAD